LENRRGKDNEVSGGVWKTVEASTREVRMGETEGRRSKRENGKKKGKEEETKKGENSRGKESSRGVKDMG